MDEVAEAAGVSHGLVFQYFGSKKGLYVACLEPLIEGFRSRVEPDPELPPVERLRAGLRNFADAISEHPAGYRNLMTRAAGFSEVREALERARWWRVSNGSPRRWGSIRIVPRSASVCARGRPTSRRRC